MEEQAPSGIQDLGEEFVVDHHRNTQFETHTLIQNQQNLNNYTHYHCEFPPQYAYQNQLDKPVIQENAARERSRVKTLRGAFLELQRTLPAVPPDTKLSKLDVLVLATTYIAHLMRTLSESDDDQKLFAAHGIMHPVKVNYYYFFFLYIHHF